MKNKILIILFIISITSLLYCLQHVFYKVNVKKCIGCTLCVTNCPAEAITMYQSKAIIDIDKCIKCGICINGNSENFKGCPTKAISTETRATITEIKEASINDSDLINKNTTNEKSKTHKVREKDCIGCQLCVSACPTKAISMVNGKAVIDPDKCINCGICINGNGGEFSGCPVKAIDGPEN